VVTDGPKVATLRQRLSEALLFPRFAAGLVVFKFPPPVTSAGHAFDVITSIGWRHVKSACFRGVCLSQQRRWFGWWKPISAPS